MSKKDKPKTKAETEERRVAKLAYSRNWMLEQRLVLVLGQKVVDKAKEGCEVSLKKIEKYGTEGHRRNAVLHWVNVKRLGL